MDLSKAYDFHSHDLLLAKLEAYGFDLNSLNLIHSYLLIGVPQGSILGPILFNIFIDDLFLYTQLCNFADDNTAYGCGTSIDLVATKLQRDMPLILNGLK